MPDTKMSVVYALDFDGVLCDSVSESSTTALKSALNLWPELNADEPFNPHLVSALSQIRPVIETGYEYVLLGRLAIETEPHLLKENFITPVLDDWASIRDGLMDKWGKTKDELVAVFGSTRDDWIENNTDSWVTANRMYVGA